MTNPIPKVAAIHDISGFGRASLTIVIPILSAMGIQVSPLTTAVLSAHSEYSGYKLVDLTDHLMEFIEHWEKLDIKFDAIYSGFLGSEKQIEIVQYFLEKFSRKGQLKVVDPVLGDDGQLYEPFRNTGIIEKMKVLIRDANIITPNITEASFLLGQKYDEKIPVKEVVHWAKELTKIGPKIAIVTSVPDIELKSSSVIAYNSEDKRCWKVVCDYLPANYPGTGDAFTSVIVGALLQGDSLPIALDRAVQFVSLGIRATFGYDYDQMEGFLLERVLGSLSAPVLRSSYQLLEV